MTRHRRLLGPALALAIIASPAQAQWADAGRFRPAAAVSNASRLQSLERLPEAERAKAIPGQYFAGLAGGVVGLLGGTLLGMMIAAGDLDIRDSDAALLVPAFAGWMGGTTYGVHKFSTVKGSPGRPLAAFGGSVLGLLGGPVAVLTVPLGARWAYNRTRSATAR